MAEVVEGLKAALADRYRIERELGAGGMATVYLAEDLRHQRPVAVKVLRPDLAAALGPERFLREVGIAARLSHPHIVGLLESGEADGFLFYVLPYVEGVSLRQRLVREGELPLPRRSARAREVLTAAGAVEVLDPGNRNMAHLMGTARMGTRPDRSVVDAWNRAHDVPNLFIVDGSSVTTGAGVNPTSTIGALALRAADGIVRRRRSWS